VRPTIGSGGFYSEEPASDQQDNPFQIVATKPPTKHSNRRSAHIFVQPWFARWYIFIPKYPNLGIFWNGKCRYMYLWQFGTFCGYSVNFPRFVMLYQE
jgi:hypothetical protein